ncbi:MAG: DUF1640 domain-containing protein [Nitrospirae bacterium]|nr:DUF1640 domain-containing protein [Nitrospirota bacterium]
MIFDTLQYAKKLREAGVPEKQAEIQAEALSEIIEDKIATRKDLKELETRLRQDIKELEYRLIIKMGAMLVAVVTILGALMKILK